MNEELMGQLEGVRSLLTVRGVQESRSNPHTWQPYSPAQVHSCSLFVCVFVCFELGSHCVAPMS